MKKTFTILSLLIISSLAFAQAPLLVEDFNYTAGDDLTAHGWASHSGTSNPILVTSPGLTFAGYVGSEIGLSAGVNNTGYDLNKLYTEQKSGSIYTSFLVNATANTGKGGYFFHFFDPNANTAFRARTFIKPVTGKMMIGFSFNASACQDSSLTTLLNFGETYLFVVKYTIVDGATNDNVSLYVFKTGDNFTTEPATPFLGPLTATRTTPSDPLSALGPDIRPMGIALRQFEAAQKITVDGFRVKTSWDLGQDVAPALAVSTNTLAIAATTDTTNTFDIISNAPWTIVSDQDWLTVSSGSGYGNATITTTATENMTADARTANVTVTTDGVNVQTIIVTQNAPAALAVSVNTLTVAAAAGSTNTFDITSNVAWTAISDQAWLTAGSGSGSGNATITLTATENPTTAVRTANITVSATGAAPQTIIVTQDASPAVLTVSTNTLTIASTASNTNTFDITSNAPWTTVSDQDWLIVSSGTGSGNATITLTATENPTATERTATVTVSADGVTAKIVTVTQEATLTGINEVSSRHFFAYPNPVSNGFLNIVDPVNSAKQIEIYNTVGKRVLSQYTSMNSIDIKKLTAGVYILKVVSDNKTISSRIIVR